MNTIITNWWMIPTMITCGGIVWALFIYDDDVNDRFLSGIGNILMLIPVLIVSVISWIIAGSLK